MNNNTPHGIRRVFPNGLKLRDLAAVEQDVTMRSFVNRRQYIAYLDQGVDQGLSLRVV